ncbi:uncharacterized protein LOC127707681 isoform X1 [Mytilus californianus]|uniref:uncharacterized protein LOC127707681 isoform X1 n=1 Tax=Mytilus californianus TaxID=6549 RepID=UPI00224698AE|nr:uncharacterized protein LOC127707681 isoform X1 [Mytilus californianus]XP_052068293.1 uncharacterized protein LOC127707681 isoform X1 [Mytilus californianus]XP_052068294.1 uncharacterized protein LOC127707681 isoform X1 [Mytilus californianus]XP_052068295.1 uncharacterized protein LOC127707681 isoform X1 [Mytilus californianus]XP_052068297.1 uncharacterized protein LOC127707681 isoform X1 [Mytilus californianus]
MTEEQEQQENFYRHSTVIVDVTKESLQQLTEFYLTNKGITYEDFIKKYQHELYHLCYNYYPCCNCATGTPPHSRGNRVLHPPQLALFLDSAGAKLPCHNPSSKSAPNCCCPVRGNITLQELDVTLARVILINFLVPPSSTERKAIDDLVKIRNESAHAKKGKMANDEFIQSIEQITKSLLIIAKIYGKETETKQRLREVCRQPFNTAIYLELQKILLQQIERDDDLKQVKQMLEKLTNIPGESVSIDNLLDGVTAVPGSSLGNATLSSIMPRNYHVVFGIEVENLTKYKLENSETYLTSGEISIPASDILPGYKEAMVATKKPYWPAFGICGIVSWLISGCDRRLVIMFTLPWPAFLNYIKYTNKLSVGISDVGITEHDRKWHATMKKLNNRYPGLNFKTEEYINSARPVKVADDTFQMSGIMGTGHQIEAKIVFKPNRVEDLAQNLKQIVLMRQSFR